MAEKVSDWKSDRNSPLYGIGVVSRLLDCDSNTIRRYEKAGLVKPSRTPGNTRMYSESDIDTLMEVHRMVESEGFNKRGVQAVLALREDVKRLEDEVRALKAEVERLKKG